MTSGWYTINPAVKEKNIPYAMNATTKIFFDLEFKVVLAMIVNTSLVFSADFR